MQSNNRKSLVSVAFGVVFLAGCFSGHASAGAVEMCASPTITTKVMKDANGYELILELENNTKSIVSVEKFYFGENMLHLRATTADDIELKQVIPLISPGVAKLVLAPGEKFMHQINLNTSFPDLQQAIMSKDVHVSLELTIRGENSCYVQKIDTSMDIAKSK